MAKQIIGALGQMKGKLMVNTHSQFSADLETINYVDKYSSECMDITVEVPMTWIHFVQNSIHVIRRSKKFIPSFLPPNWLTAHNKLTIIFKLFFISYFKIYIPNIFLYHGKNYLQFLIAILEEFNLL